MAQAKRKATIAKEKAADLKPETVGETEDMPQQQIHISARNMGILIATIILAMGSAVGVTRAIDSPVKANADTSEQYKELIKKIDKHSEDEQAAQVLILQRLSVVETKVTTIEQRRR